VKTQPVSVKVDAHFEVLDIPEATSHAFDILTLNVDARSLWPATT